MISESRVARTRGMDLGLSLISLAWLIDFL
jgi:hypothetical protein